MDEIERYKVVKDIADFSCGPKAELLTELNVEYAKIKTDVEYLSGKLGLHDMHLNL